jgi:hypothetical protein
MYLVTVFCLPATLGTVLVVSSGGFCVYLVTSFFVNLLFYVAAAVDVVFVGVGSGGGVPSVSFYK